VASIAACLFPPNSAPVCLKNTVLMTNQVHYGGGGAVAPRLRHEVLPSQQAAGMVVATTMISMITLNTIIGTLAGRPMRHRALSNAGII